MTDAKELVARLRLPVSESMYARRTDMMRALLQERSESADALEAAESRSASLAEEVERLREALRPFAEHIDEMKFDLDNHGNPLPDEEPVGWVYVTNGDFRRARTLLSENPSG